MKYTNCNTDNHFLDLMKYLAYKVPVYTGNTIAS